MDYLGNQSFGEAFGSSLLRGAQPITESLLRSRGGARERVPGDLSGREVELTSEEKPGEAITKAMREGSTAGIPLGPWGVAAGAGVGALSAGINALINKRKMPMQPVTFGGPSYSPTPLLPMPQVTP